MPRLLFYLFVCLVTRTMYQINFHVVKKNVVVNLISSIDVVMDSLFVILLIFVLLRFMLHEFFFKQ